MSRPKMPREAVTALTANARMAGFLLASGGAAGDAADLASILSQSQLRFREPA